MPPISPVYHAPLWELRDYSPILCGKRGSGKSLLLDEVAQGEVHQVYWGGTVDLSVDKPTLVGNQLASIWETAFLAHARHEEEHNDALAHRPIYSRYNPDGAIQRMHALDGMDRRLQVAGRVVHLYYDSFHNVNADIRPYVLGGCLAAIQNGWRRRRNIKIVASVRSEDLELVRPHMVGADYVKMLMAQSELRWGPTNLFRAVAMHLLEGRKPGSVTRMKVENTPGGVAPVKTPTVTQLVSMAEKVFGHTLERRAVQRLTRIEKMREESTPGEVLRILAGTVL